jgi:hypothetical protein
MLFQAMMEFCLDLLRSKFWLIGEWSIIFEKQRVSDLNKTITKKLLLTAVAIATMTFQYCGYFWFKVI